MFKHANKERSQWVNKIKLIPERGNNYEVVLTVGKLAVIGLLVAGILNTFPK